MFLNPQRASIAAAPTYVTSQRAQVVDFTDPFMPVHATLLLRRVFTNPPPPSDPSLSPYGAGAHSSDKAPSIRSVKDLIGQSTIRYGTLNKGVLIRAFRRTNESLYRTIWKRMTSFEPSVFTLTNEEGIERLRRERWGVFVGPHES